MVQGRKKGVLGRAASSRPAESSRIRKIRHLFGNKKVCLRGYKILLQHSCTLFNITKGNFSLIEGNKENSLFSKKERVHCFKDPKFCCAFGAINGMHYSDVRIYFKFSEESYPGIIQVHSEIFHLHIPVY